MLDPVPPSPVSPMLEVTVKTHSQGSSRCHQPMVPPISQPTAFCRRASPGPLTGAALCPLLLLHRAALAELCATGSLPAALHPLSRAPS